MKKYLAFLLVFMLNLLCISGAGAAGDEGTPNAESAPLLGTHRVRSALTSLAPNTPEREGRKARPEYGAADRAAARAPSPTTLERPRRKADLPQVVAKPARSEADRFSVVASTTATSANEESWRTKHEKKINSCREQMQALVSIVEESLLKGFYIAPTLETIALANTVYQLLSSSSVMNTQKNKPSVSEEKIIANISCAATDIYMLTQVIKFFLSSDAPLSKNLHKKPLEFALKGLHLLSRIHTEKYKQDLWRSTIYNTALLESWNVIYDSLDSQNPLTIDFAGKHGMKLPEAPQNLIQHQEPEAADTDERVQDTKSIADVWVDISSFTMPNQEEVSRLLQLANFSIDGLQALQGKSFSALQIRWNATQPDVNALETWVRNPSAKETVRIIGRTPLANLIRILNNPDEARWNKHFEAVTNAAAHARSDKNQYPGQGKAAHKPAGKLFPANTGFQDAVDQASINHANNPHAALWAVELQAFLARLTDAQNGK